MNKKRFFYFVIVLLIILVILAFINPIFQHKNGYNIISTASTIAEIPFIYDEFDGLNIHGVIIYKNKGTYRNLHYMISGKLAKNVFNSFFSKESRWEVYEAQNGSNMMMYFDILNTTPSDFLFETLDGEGYYANLHNNNPKTNEVWDIRIYYRNIDQRFIAYVLVNGHRFK